MHLETDSMTLLFDDLNSCGLTMERIVAVNLRNSFASDLRVGCGYAKPATKNIRVNERRMVVFDAGHVPPYSSMSSTRRKQTKQVILSRTDEVKL